MQKRNRPKILPSDTTKVVYGCGKLYITRTYDSAGEVFEVFVDMGHTGQCAIAQVEAITRCVSTGLRRGIPVQEYITQLRDIKCPNPTVYDHVEIKSCADAIAKLLAGEIK